MKSFVTPLSEKYHKSYSMIPRLEEARKKIEQKLQTKTGEVLIRIANLFENASVSDAVSENYPVTERKKHSDRSTVYDFFNKVCTSRKFDNETREYNLPPIFERGNRQSAISCLREKVLLDTIGGDSFRADGKTIPFKEENTIKVEDSRENRSCEGYLTSEKMKKVVEKFRGLGNTGELVVVASRNRMEQLVKDVSNLNPRKKQKGMTYSLKEVLGVFGIDHWVKVNNMPRVEGRPDLEYAYVYDKSKIWLGCQNGRLFNMDVQGNTAYITTYGRTRTDEDAVVRIEVKTQ